MVTRDGEFSEEREGAPTGTEMAFVKGPLWSLVILEEEFQGLGDSPAQMQWVTKKVWRMKGGHKPNVGYIFQKEEVNWRKMWAYL